MNVLGSIVGNDRMRVEDASPMPQRRGDALMGVKVSVRWLAGGRGLRGGEWRALPCVTFERAIMLLQHVASALPP